MKYCTYCGTKLEDERGVFCPECGQVLSDETENIKESKRKTEMKKHRKKKGNRKQSRRKSAVNRDYIEESESLDDGYDGYYDDVLPVDEGKIRQGIDKEMLKRIIGLLIGVLITICACVAIMYLI